MCFALRVVGETVTININELVLRFGYAGLLDLDMPRVLEAGAPCH